MRESSASDVALRRTPATSGQTPANYDREPNKHVRSGEDKYPEDLLSATTNGSSDFVGAAARVDDWEMSDELSSALGLESGPHQDTLPNSAMSARSNASALPFWASGEPSSNEALEGENDNATTPGKGQLKQPIVTQAPPKTISIKHFIELVESEEAKWPAADQKNTSLMITRLRKIFYGTPGWNKYLIPGAANIMSGYKISEKVTSRTPLSIPGNPDADIVRKKQVTTKPSTGDSPPIASQQEVELEDGSFDDIGHVFAGLDAANHPDSISDPLGIVSVKDNKAAVTWTGDLGSVVTEILFKICNNSAQAAAKSAQSLINEYASAQDMLGNIDAYVIADEYKISSSAGQKVSEILRSYYLSKSNSSDASAREHRYSRFCELTGLTGWSDGAFSNESAWIEKWAPEVAGAAALYYGALTEGVLASPARLRHIELLKQQDFPLVRPLLKNFLDALKPLITAEPK